MTKELSNHNRFAAELDTSPSPLQEALRDGLQEARGRDAARWRGNLALIALAIVVALVAVAVVG
jgi:hypothetical protein